MNRERFADYIRRFNAEDPTAFEDYLTPNVTAQNGTLHYQGIDFIHTDTQGQRRSLCIPH